jgi:hypothetical protein
VKPSSRGLFQSVESLGQSADMCGMSRVDEARRLMHVDALIEITVEKDV